jgi:hypothetical protein
MDWLKKSPLNKTPFFTQNEEKTAFLLRGKLIFYKNECQTTDAVTKQKGSNL